MLLFACQKVSAVELFPNEFGQEGQRFQFIATALHVNVFSTDAATDHDSWNHALLQLTSEGRMSTQIQAIFESLPISTFNPLPRGQISH
jgi:hypothetical protein